MVERRVLLLADALANGGAERQLTLLAKYLPSGWRARVWSLSGGPYIEVLRDLGIQVEVFERESRLDPRPALALRRVIREWRPEVVHAWGWMSCLAALPACRQWGIPLVSGVVRDANRRERRWFMTRFSMVWAALVIGNSRAGLAAWDVAPAKARLVYNGIDPDRLRLCEREQPVGAGATFRVVMAARMVPQKDWVGFVEAARQLERLQPGRWQFIGLGEGPDREHVLRLARELIRRGCVTFPESGLEVLGYLRKADAGILLTNPLLAAEGCSNAIIEYMACGLPVVCSDSGGNVELVHEGVTGHLVRASDTAGVVSRLMTLEASRADACRLGKAGRELVHERFTAEAMVAATVSVYEEALRMKGRVAQGHI